MMVRHMATVSAANDQASQEAARVLIPPVPRSCSPGPLVMTQLYSTTVSQTLRQPLRSRAVSEPPRMLLACGRATRTRAPNRYAAKESVHAAR